MEQQPILPEGEQPSTEEGFSLAKYNSTGFLWETREPGVDAEDSWDDGQHEFETLTRAVEEVMPKYLIEAIGMEEAARLALDLGLVLHTGVPVDEPHLT